MLSRIKSLKISIKTAMY